MEHTRSKIKPKLGATPLILRTMFLVCALLPAAAWAEVGEGAGTEVMNQAIQQPAAESATAASGATSSAAEVYDADEVVVTGRAANLLGRADSASEGRVSADDLSHRALLRPAEVLEAVPGLMITQHSGDGKANQYFTRGFNLDHGTDFAFSADGVPVNLVSHAHAEGYSDLNFLIPELIQEVDYRKGPYSVENGDFATAGSANFTYPFRLKTGLASLSLGEDNYVRALAAAPLDLGRAGQFYYAVEGVHDDGPWDVPENFEKYNVLLHYGLGEEHNGLIVGGSVDQGAWIATNQTPDLAVEDGQIGRFGSLDPTDGGQSHRYSLWSTWRHSTDHNEASVEGYATLSSLHLWNDFTFFLNDPVHGDQHEQQDERTVTGFKARDTYKALLGQRPQRDRVRRGFPQRQCHHPGPLCHRGAHPLEHHHRQHRGGDHGSAVHPKYRPLDPLAAHGAGLPPGLLQFQRGRSHGGRPGPSRREHAGTQGGRGAGPLGAAGALRQFRPGIPQQRRPHPDAKFAFVPDPRGAHQPAGQGPGPGRRTAPGVGGLAQHPGGLAAEAGFGADLRRRRGVQRCGRAVHTPGRRVVQQFPLETPGPGWRLRLSQARYDTEDPGDDGVQQHPGYYVPESIEQAASLTAGLEKMGPVSVDARLRYFGPRALVPDDSVRSSDSTLTSLRLAFEPAQNQMLALDVFNIFDEQVEDVSYFYPYQIKNQAGVLQPVQDGVVSHAAEPARCASPTGSNFRPKDRLAPERGPRHNWASRSPN